MHRPIWPKCGRVDALRRRFTSLSALAAGAVLAHDQIDQRHSSIFSHCYFTPQNNPIESINQFSQSIELISVKK